MSSSNVTQLLEDRRAGDEEALDRLSPILYQELRRLANLQIRRERAGHTLQATALVHEAWIKLVDQDKRTWENRAHFFAVAATAMRRILINHAVRKKAQKRGGDARQITLDELDNAFDEPVDDVLALDEALTRLGERYPDKAHIVELRFFTGLSEEEIARALNVSTRTVERGWRFARAWLKTELGKGALDEPT